MTKEEYNNIPVSYCKNCLSLNIKILDENSEFYDFCDDCGNTNIEKTNIEEWKKLYFLKYNKYLI